MTETTKGSPSDSRSAAVATDPYASILDLDAHRGTAELFAVYLRRSMRGAGTPSSRLVLAEADALLLQGPARTWPEAAVRLRFLVEQYMLTVPGQSGRQQTLARRALRDIAYLSRCEEL
jgi:hypothetical protein